MNVDRVQTAPTDRNGHCITSVREFLIIYGGYDGWSFTMNNELWSYNTISGIWKWYQPPMETANACFASTICSVENIVYIFGGSYSPYSVLSTNSLVAFDITNATWRTLSPHIEDYDHNSPPPMYGSLIFYHKESLYILGGFYNFNYFDSMYKFSLKTYTWSLVIQKGQKPFMDYRIFGTVFNNRFFTFGTSRTGTNRFRDITIFDFSTNTWTTRATSSKTQMYPDDDRKRESLTFSRNFGYLSGGMSSTTHHSDMWKIDLETLEWFKLDYSLKTCIFNHCMSVVDDFYLFSFGGMGHHPDRLNKLQKFIIRPPTLYRLCLESISRSPNMRIYAKSLPVAIANELNFNRNSS
ncbi:Kelch domain-containing protein 10 [Thelohanellus kitauei]|uniref:Kelch domain-containing protein 10 n=1 Tax=Thelohanellus kitauei TaxID=669202 RepID=A0A0C2MHP1_THEKT|nr:Kelch domain-containing protein 10 [Thelohanellus kitauei]